jgi:uncharacterized membrane protein (DUF4010 family)
MIHIQAIPEGHFPPSQIAVRIAVALTIGLLAGLEREWAHKETGVRTFAIVSLLGMITSLLSPAFTIAAFGGILLLAAFTNIRTLLADKTAEITTSVALMLTFYLGVLVGYGHLFTPVAAAIVMTLLLSLKSELTSFTGVLLRNEIRSAVLVALVGFVIYPILPNRYIDPWKLLNPRSAWAIVVVLALMGFANYLLLRLYGSRGLYMTAVLGGAVNSTATVAQLSDISMFSGGIFVSQTVPLVLLANLSMFLRNLLIVVLFAPAAARYCSVPLLIMASACTVIAFFRRTPSETLTKEMPLPSPVSFKSILFFAFVFLAIQTAATVARRFLGQAGYLIIGFIGGLVSSASTTAAAASVFTKGEANTQATVIVVTLASVASVIANLPIVFRRANGVVIRRLSIDTAIIIALGFAGLVLAI